MHMFISFNGFSDFSVFLILFVVKKLVNKLDHSWSESVVSLSISLSWLECQLEKSKIFTFSDSSESFLALVAKYDYTIQLMSLCSSWETFLSHQLVFERPWDKIAHESQSYSALFWPGWVVPCTHSVLWVQIDEECKSSHFLCLNH